MRLYKLYMTHCPPNRPKDAFYLQPILNPRSQCWYTAKGIGHCKLDKTISRMCEHAGIPGYKTNHSLRATNATWFYQAGVDEQLIMERTGHRSLEGVRSYKRTSSDQREMLSDILNTTDKGHSETAISGHTPSSIRAMPPSPAFQPYQLMPRQENQPTMQPSLTSTIPSAQLQQNQAVSLNSQYSVTQQNACRPILNFNSCSSVTINFTNK